MGIVSMASPIGSGRVFVKLSMVASAVAFLAF